MDQKTTTIRSGLVDEMDVRFTVTAQFNGPYVCGAEGHLIEPENATEKFLGAHKNLIDIKTNNTYNSFVTDSRFSFSSYQNIDELFLAPNSP